ncbi:MAG: serine acetyltransferase [Bradyrhizobium sp.]|nr:serine acetyltransferase [Bradyrhizobium sp.]MDE2472647.1 serine acetyltransferase [Bradyrhizobium sp.]
MMVDRHDPDWAADLARVGKRAAMLREQSLWAIWVYRYGRRIDRRADGLCKTVETRWYWMLFRLVETITGISIARACTIGPGLRIWHFGGVFLHPNTVIGRNCTLRQGVTIGNRGADDDGAPVIGDDVELGAYAQVIGPMRIWRRLSNRRACRRRQGAGGRRRRCRTCSPYTDVHERRA